MKTMVSVLIGVALFVSGCINLSVEQPSEEQTNEQQEATGQTSPLFEPPAPPELSAEQRTVKDVVDRFGRMWEDEDMDTFSEIIAQDPRIVVIGTDTAEYIIGYEDFRRIRQEQYDSFENVEFNVRDQRIMVSESGNAAWFTQRFDLFTLAEGTPVSLEGLRVSGVLEKRDGQWQIVQLHTSVPVAGQAAEY